MRTRFYQLVFAPLPYFCFGCFWLRYDFATPGWDQLGLWPHGVVALALGSAVGGLLQTKFDSDRVAYGGAALFGAAFIAAAFNLGHVWQYVVIEVLIGFASGVAYVAVIPLVARCFPDKVGLAVGFAVAGYVAATIIGGRVVRVLIEMFGQSSAAIVTGCLLFALTAVAIMILRPAPAAAVRAPTSTIEVGPLMMMRTSSFPTLWLSYALASTAAVMIYTLFPGHFSAVVMQQGAAVGLLSLVSPLGSLANAGARPAAGWVSDRWGGFPALRVAILLIGIGGLLALTRLPPQARLVVPFVVLGGYGAMLAIYPMLTATLFGLRHLGANYGIVLTAWAGGYVAGAWLGPRLVRAFDAPAAGFVGAVVVSLVALLLASSCARRARRPASFSPSSA